MLSDGDKYTVIWDSRLIPTHNIKPMSFEFDRTKQASRRKNQTLQSFFSNYDRSLVPKIDQWFQYWASERGASSKECNLLVNAFCQAVDSAKTGAKVFLDRSLKPKGRAFGFIEKMVERGKEFSK